ncbi:L-alanine-DL-glutamate epimerase [Natronorubrum sediminis]|uniref:L-alanine-DL-glutamate epimerase n=1 Tax=Natronorubrum sediminis TaxID=640943 RepID=A0A1H6G8A6_9EURY|nr:mandelate racemase/muconate lactonizing enzyme family protein [Natronorubrum sediminis]SEH18095.1 L-alanine-DL-glutamate epimerase [Natronorubrum sediminis]
MEITDVRAVPLSATIPEEHQFRSDFGARVKNDATLIYVDTDAGITGIGTSLGTPSVVKAIVEDSLRSALVGEDPTYVERLWSKLYNGSRTEPALERGYTQPRYDRRGITFEAISGIDIALWDILGKHLEQPIYKLLGAARDSVQAYGSGGWAPGEEAGPQLQGYVDEHGFDAVKMRVVGEDDFGIEHTVSRVESARETLGDDIDIMVDAHGSLDVTTAIRLANRLEEYDIGWFEEPVTPDDHAALAEVRASTEIPIATGESEFTRFDYRSLLEHDATDILQPDVARAGGFTEIRRVAAMGSARGVQTIPHAWGSAVLLAASIHLAMALPNCHILEVPQAPYMPMLWDFFEEDFEIDDGRVVAPSRPGLGFTVQDDVEERFAFTEGPEYVY